MLSLPLPFRNMSRTGVSRQENRSAILAEQAMEQRLDNYEPRHKIPKRLWLHRLTFHFSRWPHIKPLLAARRDDTALAAHRTIVPFDTRTISKLEMQAAKRLSLIWTDESPFFKNQELLTKEQLRAAAPEVLGFDATEEKYYMLFRSQEENCSRGEWVSVVGLREASVNVTRRRQ